MTLSLISDMYLHPSSCSSIPVSLADGTTAFKVEEIPWAMIYWRASVSLTLNEHSEYSKHTLQASCWLRSYNGYVPESVSQQLTRPRFLLQHFNVGRCIALERGDHPPALEQRKIVWLCLDEPYGSGWQWSLLDIKACIGTAWSRLTRVFRV